jgi:hypothetical protein
LRSKKNRMNDSENEQPARFRFACCAKTNKVVTAAGLTDGANLRRNGIQMIPLERRTGGFLPPTR